MNAQELRVGNLLLNRNGEVEAICEVCDCYGVGFVKFDGDSQLTAMQYVNAIPITEEWLMKFGFRKVTDIIFLSPHQDSSNGYFQTLVYDLLDKEFIITNNQEDYRAVEIKYIHQIQNLFFALVGEELELKN